jgi:hypothetical protein
VAADVLAISIETDVFWTRACILRNFSRGRACEWLSARTARTIAFKACCLCIDAGESFGFRFGEMMMMVCFSPNRNLLEATSWWRNILGPAAASEEVKRKESFFRPDSDCDRSPDLYRVEINARVCLLSCQTVVKLLFGYC